MKAAIADQRNAKGKEINRLNTRTMPRFRKWRLEDMGSNHWVLAFDHGPLPDSDRSGAGSVRLFFHCCRRPPERFNGKGCARPTMDEYTDLVELFGGELDQFDAQLIEDDVWQNLTEDQFLFEVSCITIGCKRPAKNGLRCLIHGCRVLDCTKSRKVRGMCHEHAKTKAICATSGCGKWQQTNRRCKSCRLNWIKRAGSKTASTMSE